MPKISKTVVDALEPAASGDVFLWDAELKGFGVRVKESGAKSYVLSYRNRHGQRRRLTIGRHGELTTAQARDRAAQLLAQIRFGADPAEARQEERQALTVADLIDAYLADGPAARPDKKASSWRTDRSNLQRHARPLLGNKRARALVKADIERWHRGVATGESATDERTGARGRAIVKGGKGTAARALAVLSAAFAWACERGMIPSNPARGVKAFKGEKRERFLSVDELARLGEALAAMVDGHELNPKAAAIIKLLALTGCRKAEITTMQWSFVCIEQGCLDLPDGKTGARRVPLSAAALGVLAALPRAHGQRWVFPADRTGNGPYTLNYVVWQRVAVRAGLPGVRLHDLRHNSESRIIPSAGPEGAGMGGVCAAWAGWQSA
ncbi:MAG: integrase family protein [Defluviicoccus sp.]